MRRSQILARRGLPAAGAPSIVRPATASAASPVPAASPARAPPPAPPASPAAAPATSGDAPLAAAAAEVRPPLAPVANARPGFKRPALVSKAPAKSPASGAAEPAPEDRYFSVMYTKRSTKKHKTYSDGVIIVSARSVTLKDMEEKQVAKNTMAFRLERLGAGSELEVGNYELEVVAEVPAAEFLSGAAFIGAVRGSGGGGGGGGGNGAPGEPKQRATALENRRKANAQLLTLSLAPASGAPRAKGLALTAAAAAAAAAARPLFDPDEPGALVLNRERAGETPVVVDPCLSKHLRPHQREGVRFLYRCVMGVSNPSFHGAILADAMGLGKTLQTITLLWTLLRSGPAGVPVISKAIVVCPTSLTGTWRGEFSRWLGGQRLKPLVLSSSLKPGEQSDAIRDFTRVTTLPVLIVGYELFRKHAESFTKLRDALVICDEGHRLKNSQGNQTIAALCQIPTRRRLLLTGTPVQNDLTEFYAMCEFVNPTFLGSLNQFRNSFDLPISRSRDAACSEKERAIGEARAKELWKRTSSFVLRRTAEVNRRFLPPKVEQVLLAPLTPLQVLVYRAMLSSKAVRRLTGFGGETSGINPLSCITALKKLCNHAGLVFRDLREAGGAGDEGAGGGGGGGGVGDPDSLYGKVGALFPAGFESELHSPAHSGKLALLAAMFDELDRDFPDDRVVLVSNYCQTLDMLDHWCRRRGYASVRLDGSTTADQRDARVSEFNSASSRVRVFLLSAQAGGMGLSLIGGNRLVLFDPSWNPAVDQQAMARIWRDGQKKTCWIYRLLAAGSIDEKIFQRQLRKTEMQLAVVDDVADAARNFEQEDIKDLFVLNEHAVCDTFDIMRGGRERLRGGDAYEFFESLEQVADPILAALPRDVLRFVMHRRLDAADAKQQEQPPPQQEQQQQEQGERGAEGDEEQRQPADDESNPFSGRREDVDEAAEAAQAAAAEDARASEEARDDEEAFEDGGESEGSLLQQLAAPRRARVIDSDEEEEGEGAGAGAEAKQSRPQPPGDSVDALDFDVSELEAPAKRARLSADEG